VNRLDEFPSSAGHLVVIVMPIREHIFAPDQRLTILSRFHCLIGGRFTMPGIACLYGHQISPYTLTIGNEGEKGDMASGLATDGH
jgi:hypothetical protein